MSYTDEVFDTSVVSDSDTPFKINPITREIEPKSPKKTVLMQGDHNSERFTFEIPRFIEGRDVALCNIVQVCYINTGSNGRTSSGVYTVNDMNVYPFVNDILTCSWLISQNATKYAGKLNFMLRFATVEDDATIKYAWNSQVFEGIKIADALDSADTFIGDYVDVIEQWKNSVMEEFTIYVDQSVKNHVHVAQIETNANNISKLTTEMTVQKARMDTFTKLTSGSTTGDAELADIRVGADGETYETAGKAVREQFKTLSEQMDNLTTVTNPDIEIGTIGEGLYDDMLNRARFVSPIKFWNAKLFISALSDYMYGYTIYDKNKVYDGVDHKWNSMTSDKEIDLVGEGYIAMNFRRTDNVNITEDDLAILKAAVRIENIDALDQISDIKKELSAGFIINEDFQLEIGGISAGEPLYMATRARFTENIRLCPGSTVYIRKNSEYMYGYTIYDINGVYDGVDHKWNNMINNVSIAIDSDCYIRMTFRRVDDTKITAGDIATLTELIQIETRETGDSIAKKVRQLRVDVDEIDTSAHINHLTASLGIEYGRYNGASYVFVRVPKTCCDGTKLRPNVRLSSVSGTADGKNRSSLTYAEENKTIFVLNAGLFDMNTGIPAGQTIIDGVSIINEPMTDDMGATISDSECYPLCIDANGDLSAPYPRSVDTADMISDGVIHAVTGWGKIIENFASCPDTVENEIVHSGTYIRQVIGQFQNGDYFVCTVDQSRGSVENEAGITYSDLAQLLIDKGVKFAYSLDGGGSAETVIGVRQLNPIYEGTVGRAIPTIISFEEIN